MKPVYLVTESSTNTEIIALFVSMRYSLSLVGWASSPSMKTAGAHPTPQDMYLTNTGTAISKDFCQQSLCREQNLLHLVADILLARSPEPFSRERMRPVALVINANTTSSGAIQEQANTITSLLLPASSGVPYKVFMD